jgi:hypothetical protein
MTSGWAQRVVDPDGRYVVFDASSHLHIAQGMRAWMLDHVTEILGAVERPAVREDDPRPGRERFYGANFAETGQWVRVVVDFNDEPAWVVTALVQDNDPRLKR